jgi:hypothetical protein
VPPEVAATIASGQAAVPVAAEMTTSPSENPVVAPEQAAEISSSSASQTPAVPAKKLYGAALKNKEAAEKRRLEAAASQPQEAEPSLSAGHITQPLAQADATDGSQSSRKGRSARKPAASSKAAGAAAAQKAVPAPTLGAAAAQEAVPTPTLGAAVPAPTLGAAAAQEAVPAPTLGAADAQGAVPAPTLAGARAMSQAAAQQLPGKSSAGAEFLASTLDKTTIGTAVSEMAAANAGSELGDDTLMSLLRRRLKSVVVERDEVWAILSDERKSRLAEIKRLNGIIEKLFLQSQNDRNALRDEYNIRNRSYERHD